MPSWGQDAGGQAAAAPLRNVAGSPQFGRGIETRKQVLGAVRAGKVGRGKLWGGCKRQGRCEEISRVEARSPPNGACSPRGLHGSSTGYPGAPGKSGLLQRLLPIHPGPSKAAQGAQNTAQRMAGPGLRCGLKAAWTGMQTDLFTADTPTPQWALRAPDNPAPLLCPH